ncbi:MAG: hypothetical protein N3E37_00030, partial [Candidatus Micrarchaeota archaeon]|nr:hypothetical protein [Candidatus Micrarchaeota archaeon]
AINGDLLYPEYFHNDAETFKRYDTTRHHNNLKAVFSEDNRLVAVAKIIKSVKNNKPTYFLAPKKVFLSEL